MSKKTKVSVIVLSLMLMITGMSCMTVSRYLAPGTVDKEAVKYVVEAGVAEPNDFRGYPNLAKVEKLEKDVNIAHKVNRCKLEQAIEIEDMKYSIHKRVVTEDRIAGQERAEVLFGKEGLLTLGLSMAGCGGLAGFIGLMRKRPGDITSQEMELALAEAMGKTNGELSEKEKQLVEIVKGVQRFMDTYREKSPEVVSDMKEMFDRTQDTSTRVAVAKIKKQII